MQPWWRSCLAECRWPKPGCTRAVAGVSWLEDWADKLKPLGLRPVVSDQRETFKGLGGAQQTSDRAWEFPVGLQGAHTTITFQEIAGDMPGLTAKGDLKRWGADMRFSEGRMDLVGLDRWNLPLADDNRLVKLNFLEFDKARLLKDEFLDRFRSDDDGKEKAYLCVEAWLPQLGGKPGIMKRKEKRLINCGMGEISALLGSMTDHGSTFLVEFHLGRSVLTKVAVAGGHVVGEPVALKQKTHQKIKTTACLNILSTTSPQLAVVTLSASEMCDMEDDALELATKVADEQRKDGKEILILGCGVLT